MMTKNGPPQINDYLEHANSSRSFFCSTQGSIVVVSCDIEGGRRNLLPIFSDFYDCGYSSPHILNSLYMHINILKSVSNSAETNSMTSISIHALINKRLCYFSDKIAIHRQNEVSVFLINNVYFIWVVLGRARTNEI